MIKQKLFLLLFCTVFVILLNSKVCSQETFKGYCNEFTSSEVTLKFRFFVLNNDWGGKKNPEIIIGGNLISDKKTTKIDTTIALTRNNVSSVYENSNPFVLCVEIGTDVDSLVFVLNSFYTFTVRKKVERDENINHIFSQKVNYEISDAVNSSFSIISNRNNTIICKNEIAEKIKEIIKKGEHYRDFSYFEGNADVALGVDFLGNKIVSFDINNNQADMISNFYKNDTFNSPEGIAIDNDSIYVADWGNHRVVVFDLKGNFKFSFGSFGKNDINNQNKGNTARFIFPTRISIEEDTEGQEVTVGTKKIKVFKEKHILVADRYGVHKFDSQGHYLHSPVRAGGDFPEGSFYAIAINGYGSTNLYVAKKGR